MENPQNFRTLIEDLKKKYLKNSGQDSRRISTTGTQDKCQKLIQSLKILKHRLKIFEEINSKSLTEHERVFRTEVHFKCRKPKA